MGGDNISRFHRRKNPGLVGKFESVAKTALARLQTSNLQNPNDHLLNFHTVLGLPGRFLVGKRKREKNGGNLDSHFEKVSDSDR